MNNKKLFIFFAIIVATVGVTACSKSKTATQVSNTATTNTKTEQVAPKTVDSNTDSYKNIEMTGYKVDGMSIGVSFGQNTHPFFKAMQAGIEAACKDYGIKKISIQSADSTLEKQVTQIENLSTSGITTLLINPYDSEGVATAVQQAIDDGVNVFSMDINIQGAHPVGRQYS